MKGTNNWSDDLFSLQLRSRTLDRRFSINGQQQDVQEFLRYLLSCIDDCEKDYSKLIFEISQMQPSHSFNDTLSGDSSTCDQKPPPIQNKKRKLDDIQTEVVNSDSCVSFDTTSTEEKDKTNLPSSKRVRNNESQSNQLSNITHNNMQSTVKFEYFRPTENTINVLTSSKVESFVERLFQGQSINSIKCLECENISQRTETFLDLSLTIAKNRNLEWSISQFFTSERYSLTLSRKGYIQYKNSPHRLLLLDFEVITNIIVNIVEHSLKYAKCNIEFFFENI